MRIVVFSDSHGDIWNLRETVEKHLSDSELFIHLGDKRDELDMIRSIYPEKAFLSVKGNCDYSSAEPLEAFYSADSAKIMYTHGHMYNVKYTLNSLISSAVSNNCRIVLFGHTHIAMCDYLDGLYILNPGSIACPRFGEPSYMTVDITKAGIVPNIIKLK